MLLNKLSTLLLSLFCAATLSAEVITWKAPEGFDSNAYYSVKVNGVDVPVYDTPIASYAVFDFTGTVKVEVTTKYDVRWVDLRPMRLQWEPTLTGHHTFYFEMDRPENVSVELNGRIRQQPLFLFANAPETDRPKKGDKNVVWFESGKLYKDVSLELKDNQTVYIEGGAVLQGNIWAAGKKNIRIMGRGIMDGHLVRTSEHIAPAHRQFIQLKDCHNVEIRDIILHDASTWQVVPHHCDKVLIKGIRIVSEHGGDDGMDIVRSTNVVIDGVFAHTKDDCIAIKGHGDYPSDHYTGDIVVRNCTFWNSIWGNAIEVGFELRSAEVKNILFENIDIIHCEDGAAISIHNADSAHVHNIAFQNIRVEDTRQKLFDVAIFWSQWSVDGIRGTPEFDKTNYMHGAWDGVYYPVKGTEEAVRLKRGRVSNILFKDIQIIGGPLPFSVFYGYDDVRNIDGVVIDNLTYMGRKLTTEKEAKISKENTLNLQIR